MKKIKSLKVKMPLIIISMVILFIIILITVIEIKVSKSIEGITYEGYNNTVMGYASLIDNWFDDQLIIADIFSISEEFSKYLELRTEDLQNAALNNLKKFKSINKYIINIGLCDLNGNILTDSDNSDLLGKNIFNIHPDLKKIDSASKGVFSENITHSITTGGWSLTLIEKVLSVNSQTIGYLYLHLTGLS